MLSGRIRSAPACGVPRLNPLPSHNIIKAFTTLCSPGWLLQLPTRLNFSTVGQCLMYLCLVST